MNNDKTVEIAEKYYQSLAPHRKEREGGKIIKDLLELLTAERRRAEELQREIDLQKAWRKDFADRAENNREEIFRLESLLQEAEKEIEQYRQVTYGERELPDADLKQDQAYLAFNLAIMSKGARDNAKKVKELESKLKAQDELIGKCREALQNTRATLMLCESKINQIPFSAQYVLTSARLVKEALNELDKVMGESK